MEWSAQDASLLLFAAWIFERRSGEGNGDLRRRCANMVGGMQVVVVLASTYSAFHREFRRHQTCFVTLDA